MLNTDKRADDLVDQTFTTEGVVMSTEQLTLDQLVRRFGAGDVNAVRGEKESAMMISPAELLDTSVAQLQTLSAFLGEQLGDRNDRPDSATSESRACGEILLSLSVLILKLEAARRMAPGGEGIGWREGREVS
jgi:hypothetical protein